MRGSNPRARFIRRSATELIRFWCSACFGATQPHAQRPHAESYSLTRHLFRSGGKGVAVG